MGNAIGQVLSFGVGVAISPVPIIAVVLLVSSGASASDEGAPATWVSVLKIVLGVLLVLVAARQFRGRPRGEQEGELPKWMQSIDAFKAPRRWAPACCSRP